MGNLASRRVKLGGRVSSLWMRKILGVTGEKPVFKYPCPISEYIPPLYHRAGVEFSD